MFEGAFSLGPAQMYKLGFHIIFVHGNHILRVTLSRDITSKRFASSEKEPTLKVKNLLPMGANSFLLE